MRRFCSILFIGASLLGTFGCASAYQKMVGSNIDQVYFKTFVVEYLSVWDAAIDALKTSPMELVNRENGILQTKWIDNTAERNMLDSNGRESLYVRAQFRFRVVLAKGFFEGRPSVKVSVQKEQQYQRDVLEGWRNLETDGIQENAMLYRIGKLIDMRERVNQMEQDLLKRQMKEAVETGADPVPATDPELD